MFSKRSENRIEPRGGGSLRLQLLRWLLVPLLVLLSINAWLSNRAAVATADAAYDRLLTASADAIAEDVELRDGEIMVDLPYAALELLESNLQERIFYRVIGPGGRTVTGYDDLPQPPGDAAATAADRPRRYAAQYRGERIHLVALHKTLYGGATPTPVEVIVAETGEARDALSHQILMDAVARQSVLIAAAALLVWFGLVRGLRPLEQLRRALERRGVDDLSPVNEAAVQVEVRPLIGALNRHTARIERLLTARQRLIADASHQMRTPLSGLRTQIDFSLRQPDAALWQRTLVDARADIDRMSRLVAQLLVHARVDPDARHAHPFVPVDWPELVRATLLEFVPAARQRAMDIAFENQGGTGVLLGNAVLLREMLANLIDNAIRYARHGGGIVVRVSMHASPILEVEDDGPGIDADERKRVFERFYRSKAVSDQLPGSGLGLSIVRDVAAAHGGTVALLDAAGGRGLRVRVELPGAAARTTA